MAFMTSLEIVSTDCFFPCLLLWTYGTCVLMGITGNTKRKHILSLSLTWTGDWTKFQLSLFPGFYEVVVQKYKLWKTFSQGAENTERILRFKERLEKYWFRKPQTTGQYLQKEWSFWMLFSSLNIAYT